ncbi:MAG: hypothetical protein MZV64_38800 [Ignavibacteriales bacterium]|nr:hypothetical protein [Ignavibacteriales bacterium]
MKRNKIKTKLKLIRHTILYVGVIENRKNILGILKVADELKENKDIRFLLVGKIELWRQENNQRSGKEKECDISFKY